MQFFRQAKKLSGGGSKYRMRKLTDEMMNEIEIHFSLKRESKHFSLIIVVIAPGEFDVLVRCK